MNKKILIVEDDQFIRELYERQVKLAGFEVEVTFSGQAALEMMDKVKYDLVMLDLNIPDVSGFQILEHIKQSDHHKGLNILVLSNVAEDSMIQKALSLGAHSFIIKSTYTPEQVVTQVKSLVS